MTARVEQLRIGVLGAARISELSIIDPAAATGTRLVAVAARDRPSSVQVPEGGARGETSVTITAAIAHRGRPAGCDLDVRFDDVNGTDLVRFAAVVAGMAH